MRPLDPVITALVLKCCSGLERSIRKSGPLAGLLHESEQRHRQPFSVPGHALLQAPSPPSHVFHELLRQPQRPASFRLLPTSSPSARPPPFFLPIQIQPAQLQTPPHDHSGIAHRLLPHLVCVPVGDAMVPVSQRQLDVTSWAHVHRHATLTICTDDAN